MKQVDTILLVEDVNISKKFYLNIMKLEILHDWNSMIVFKNRFAIHQTDKLKPQNIMEKHLKKGKQGTNNIIIYIELENNDLKGFYNYLLEKNVKILHGIEDIGWQKIIRVYDPDGYIIEIGTPIKE